MPYSPGFDLQVGPQDSFQPLDFNTREGQTQLIG